jgi:eukaryotic-like serine/threonine-protein kinase
MTPSASLPGVQERVALLAKLYLALGTFFIVATNVHRIAFLDAGIRDVLDVTTLTQLPMMLLQLGVWYAARRGSLRTERLVALGDIVVSLGTMAGIALRVPLVTWMPSHRIEVAIVLASCCVLLSRAIVVPSTPRTTAIVTAIGVVPAVLLAKGAETMAFTSMWGVAIVCLATFVSRTIYGLREKVTRAKQLGQYVLERKIGEGGMGQVYLARHRTLRRPTAVKLLPPERAGSATVARFEREVRQTSRLSHPNTVAIYDYGRTHDGVFYYAMEYLDGIDLQRLVEREGPLPPSRIVHILRQITGALGEAHTRGLVHRDIKPANVILCDRGGVKDTVKVVDFGLVKEVSTDPALTDLNAIIGTPRYLSPEAIMSPDAVDGRADLYSLGVLAYFLLTARDLFDGKNMMEVCVAHLTEPPISPSVRRPDLLVPADLERIVLACLEKNPAARPANAIELREALRACDLPEWTEADAERAWSDQGERSGLDPERTTSGRPAIDALGKTEPTRSYKVGMARAAGRA